MKRILSLLTSAAMISTPVFAALSLKKDPIDHANQEIRNRLGLMDGTHSFEDGDMLVTEYSEDRVTLHGDGCQVDFRMETSIRQDIEGVRVRFVLSEMDVTVENFDSEKRLSFIQYPILDEEKEKVKNEPDEIKVSQAISNKSAFNLFERGYMSEEEYEEHRRRHGHSSPEGRIFVGFISMFFHLLTGDIFKDYLRQTVEFEIDNDKIKEVTVKIENKKVTCEL